MDDFEELLINIDEDDGEYKKLIDEEFDVDIAQEESEEDEQDNISTEDFSPETEVTSDSQTVNEDQKSDSHVKDEPLHENDKSAEKISPEDDLLLFKIPGTKSFNTKEPYLIQINNEKLDEEKENLKLSFYFISKKETDDSLHRNIRDNLMRFIRKPNENIQNKYSEFIYKIISLEIEKIIKYFLIEDGQNKLFVYHLGPLVLYKIISKIFEKNNIGFCYKQIKVNKSSKFFPENFIIETVLKWYTENINVLKLPFDSIQHLEAIKSLSEKKYQRELRIFNQKLFTINQKVGSQKRISSEQLLLLKGEEWFGLSNIEVFKRFSDRTIFHRPL